MSNQATVAAAGGRSSTPFWVTLIAVFAAIPAILFSILIVIAFTGFIDGVTADRTAHSTAALGAGQAVQIEVDTGGVSVVPGPDGQVAVDDRITVRAPTRDLARRVLDQHMASRIETSPDGVRILVSGLPGGFAISRSTEVVVHVPAAVRLVVNVNTGGALVRGLTGDLDLTTATGGFDVQDITVSGQVRISAGTGGINVAGATRMAGGTLDLTAGSGGINVRLPSNTNARYDLSAATGGVEVRASGGTTRSGGGVGQTLTGVLGNGSGGLIRARTSAGGIELNAEGGALGLPVIVATPPLVTRSAVPSPSGG